MEEKMDLRVRKTYLALQNAFTELLEDKCFEDFTVNELCEKAMIRRTTFYKHFADKYEYFTFYLKEICSTFQEQLEPDIISKDMNEYFFQMGIKLLGFMNEHKKLVEHISKSDMFHVLLNILSEHITQDLILLYKCNHKDNNIDILALESTAAFYSGGLLNMLLYFMKQHKGIDEELFSKTISDVICKKSIFDIN